MLTACAAGLETCSPHDRKLPGANLVDGLLRHHSFSVGIVARLFSDPLRIKRPPKRWLNHADETHDLRWAKRQ